jgi:hypothetical protein
LEKRSLGSVGESLSGAAATAAERIKTETVAAGERLMDVAGERGLNAQGLQEIAEAADAFGKAFSGEEAGASKPKASEPLPETQAETQAQSTDRPTRPIASQHGRAQPVRQARRSE